MDLPAAVGQPFLVKSCSLASIAEGIHASSLYELREKLAQINENCIYYHFWGVKMNPQFVHTQHHNDFAAWAYHSLHDHVLAERLSVIDPTEFDSLEALRQEMLETIDTRLEDYELHLSSKREARFYFIRSMIIVFESVLQLSSPEELPKAAGTLPPSSLFYHFIDARGRTAEKTDDFSLWLKMYGDQYAGLIESIQSIDPYFLTLTQLREVLEKTIKDYFDA
jgi:hypothetical protein